MATGSMLDIGPTLDMVNTFGESGENMATLSTKASTISRLDMQKQKLGFLSKTKKGSLSFRNKKGMSLLERR